ncbi:MAG: hypothetical protein K2K59_02000, partial [Muribaculaceae bacterium]|nr:hypothetical protein [Muribaculaceae bacterium]
GLYSPWRAMGLWGFERRHPAASWQISRVYGDVNHELPYKTEDHFIEANIVARAPRGPVIYSPVD